MNKTQQEEMMTIDDQEAKVPQSAIQVEMFIRICR